MLDSLSELVLRAEGIPVRLDPLSRLEALVCDVQTWKDSAGKTFLLKNSPFSLLEVSLQQSNQHMNEAGWGNYLTGVLFLKVLCPRCDIGAVPQKSRCKKSKDAAQPGKKSPAGLDSLCDVERALSESKDSASAVSG